MIEPLTPSDLMRQANDTSETYFNRAVRIIDEKFGEGYARENPGLVGDFMKTAAHDFDTAIQHQDIECLIQEVSRSSDAFEHIAGSVSDITFFIKYKLSDSFHQHSLVIAAAIQEFRLLCEDYLAFISRKCK